MQRGEQMKKNVLIFGGSGALGREIIKKLLSQDMRIYATYHSHKESLEQLRKETDSSEENLSFLSCDVTEETQVQSVVDHVITEQKKIDVLINCVGTMELSLFMEKSKADWEKTITTNLTSVFSTCRAVVPHMMDQQEGVILNFSSLSGMYGMTGIVDYCAAKSGIIGFTKALAAELGRFGIRVNCISPGMIESEMTEQSREKVGKGIKKMIPLRRFGKPADISGIVAFLISEEAQYITGENLVVGGGAGSALPIG